MTSLHHPQLSEGHQKLKRHNLGASLPPPIYRWRISLQQPEKSSVQFFVHTKKKTAIIQDDRFDQSGARFIQKLAKFFGFLHNQATDINCRCSNQCRNGTREFADTENNTLKIEGFAYAQRFNRLQIMRRRSKIVLNSRYSPPQHHNFLRVLTAYAFFINQLIFCVSKIMNFEASLKDPPVANTKW